MRKITEDAVEAFENDKPFKRSNTEVEVNPTRLYLHDNLIAKKENGLWITDAGWQTNTTKERLNGIPGVHIVQRNWNWFLKDKNDLCEFKKWNGEWKKIT